MTNLYTIEYETPGDGGMAYRSTSVAGDTAKAALEEFYRNHPGAEIRELRRVHVGGR